MSGIYVASRVHHAEMWKDLYLVPKPNGPEFSGFIYGWES